jgi:hypothetical protein
MIPLTKRVDLGSLLCFLVQKLQGLDSDLSEELVNTKAIYALARRDVEMCWHVFHCFSEDHVLCS